jgi:hypothetical protein
MFVNQEAFRRGCADAQEADPRDGAAAQGGYFLRTASPFTGPEVRLWEVESLLRSELAVLQPVTPYGSTLDHDGGVISFLGNL